MTDTLYVPTVLVVDDNPNNVKVVALLLRSLKYKIAIATDGEQAVNMVEKTRPDLILLDVMMPKMDGFEACRLIKSKPHNQNIPVIFITALSDTDNLVTGFKAGGVDYITKPFNKDELITRVKTHLDLKLTRDKLEQTLNHLAELNALKDKMFSVIGHDLRSPLSSVKMTLEFLSKIAPGKDEILGEQINVMLKTTDEVFNLLENLLGWAKSQSGNLSINPENIKIAEIVQSIYTLNKGNLDLKKIKFIANIPEDLEVYADISTFKVILRNLVSNAIKFTPNEGTITVAAIPSNSDVLITVTDTGIGIAEENIPKILDSKTHYTTYGTNREAGSGLGLVLCKDFAEKNGGTIWLESTLGKGTTFFVKLPAKKE